MNHQEGKIHTILRKICKDRFGYLLLVPALIVFILFRTYPLVKAIVYSFYEVNPIGESLYMGLSNYREMLSTPEFIGSIGVTFLFTIVTVPLMLVVALSLALACSYKPLKGKSFFKAIFFMPFILSWVVVGIIWKWYFSAKFGVVNILLNTVGIPPQSWLVDTRLTLPCVIFVTLWKLSGLFMVIFAANLQMINPELYDAASIDGAGSLQKFRYVTIYQLMPAIVTSIILGTIFFFRTFTIIFTMTGGDPAGTTNLLAYYIYTLGLESFEFGYAFVGITFMFMVVSMILIFQIILTRKKRAVTVYG